MFACIEKRDAGVGPRVGGARIFGPSKRACPDLHTNYHWGAYELSLAGLDNTTWISQTCEGFQHVTHSALERVDINGSSNTYIFLSQA